MEGELIMKNKSIDSIILEEVIWILKQKKEKALWKYEQIQPGRGKSNNKEWDDVVKLDMKIELLNKYHDQLKGGKSRNG
jgi:hypothetical protein